MQVARMPRYTSPMPDAEKIEQRHGRIPKRILLTGAAGYIGSHTAAHLVEAGCHVVALDDLSAGSRRAVPRAAEFVRGDAADRELVARLIKEHRIEAALHFAARVVVSESVENPGAYYRANALASLELMEACIAGGVGMFVFSSSAAVYGAPRAVPVGEDAECAPVNPYGASKLMSEWMLRDLAAAEPRFRFVALRYFNAAGARLDGSLGQESPRATHLVKVACEAACGRRDGLSIFGDDYPTPDGTCIRDYIHVEDLARAHAGALAHLAGGGESAALNCGYGRGSSVREVVACVKKVSGVDFPVRIAPRRAGDPPELVADNARIRALGWKPRHDDLEVICRSAYQWERSLPRT